MRAICRTLHGKSRGLRLHHDQCAICTPCLSIGTLVRSFREDSARVCRTHEAMRQRTRTPSKASKAAIKPLGILPQPKPNGRVHHARSKPFSLALAQFAPRKGDVDANVDLIGQALSTLADDRRQFPDVVVFPEASLSGYFVEGGVHEVAVSAREAARLVNAAAKKACA